MRIRLLREPSDAGATLSVWFVDDVFQCFGLEDEIREVPGKPVGSWKIDGQTAIPAGRYRVLVTPSQRFGRDLPILVDVPGFAGIRFHPGNTQADTKGCPLPGRTRGTATVGSSRLAFNPFFKKIRAAIATGDEVWVDVENPAGYMTSGHIPAGKVE